MKLNILWMYHDLMDLYGDKGNIQVLKTRCEKRNIECIVDTCTLNEEKDISKYDLFFLGGGADREQNLLYKDLLRRKENIQKALDSHTTFLLICGGYQLFGKYYKDANGNVVEGLGFFPYFTEASLDKKRCVGNIVVQTTMDGKELTVVGFENHGGMTKNVDRPFGKVIKGYGNTDQGEYEGYLTDTVLATYMHGPLLPKNPEVADLLIKRALKKNYGDVTLDSLDDTLEEKAREVMLKRFELNK